MSKFLLVDFRMMRFKGIRHGSPTSSSASRLGSRHRHRKRLRGPARRAAALDGEVAWVFLEKPQGGAAKCLHDWFD